MFLAVFGTGSVSSDPGGLGSQRREITRVARLLVWAAFVMACAGTASVVIQTWFVKAMPCDRNGDGWVSTSEAVEVNHSALRSLAGLTLWLLVPLVLAVPTGIVAAAWCRRWWPLLASVLAFLAIVFLLNVTLANNPGYDYYFCGD